MENKIYPEIWDDEEVLDYLVEYFKELKQFISNTVDKNMGIIISIS